MTPKHLDLHTGLGGFSLAARWSGFETVAHSEIEPYCNELLSARFPGIPNLGDVRKICRRSYDCLGHIDFPDIWDEADARELDEGPEPGCFCPICSEEAGEPIDFDDCDCIGTNQFTSKYGFPDVLTSGFPCQDVSNNGTRKGAIKGERSGLWRETLRITEQIGVPFVVLENVAALKTRGIDTIADEFEKLGYAFGTVVVPGYAVGGAHQRERVFAVAYLTSFGVEGLWTPRKQEPQSLALSPLPLRGSDGQWQAEPDLRRVVHGLPAGVDGPQRINERVKALGNAIIPQIGCAIFDILPDLARQFKLWQDQQ